MAAMKQLQFEAPLTVSIGNNVPGVEMYRLLCTQGHHRWDIDRPASKQKVPWKVAMRKWTEEIV